MWYPVLAGFGNAAADDTSLASRQKRRRQVANLADFLNREPGQPTPRAAPTGR